MCFAIGSQHLPSTKGAGAKTRLESSRKKFKRIVYMVGYSGAGRHPGEEARGMGANAHRRRPPWCVFSDDTVSACAFADAVSACAFAGAVSACAFADAVSTWVSTSTCLDDVHCRDRRGGNQMPCLRVHVYVCACARVCTCVYVCVRGAERPEEVYDGRSLYERYVQARTQAQRHPYTHMHAHARAHTDVPYASMRLSCSGNADQLLLLIRCQ